jgi:hypothetical protein
MTCAVLGLQLTVTQTFITPQFIPVSQYWLKLGCVCNDFLKVEAERLKSEGDERDERDEEDVEAGEGAEDANIEDDANNGDDAPDALQRMMAQVQAVHGSTMVCAHFVICCIFFLLRHLLRDLVNCSTSCRKRC